MTFNVAIDGPAGAGKSTIAKMVAKKLSFIYVDSGAMYRAMSVYFLRMGVDINDENAVSEVCTGANITISYDKDGSQQVFLNGENVTGSLRKEEVGKTASVTSAYPRVREHLLELQRQLAKSADIIMDGRDIGTTILPNADVKIYLNASSAVRAERRVKELRENGQECDFEEIKKGIEERDYRDMTRKVSPLAKAEDAVEVDSSYMTIDEVCDAIIAIIQEKRVNIKE